MGLMHPYGSLGVPQTPKNHNTLIEVFKFGRSYELGKVKEVPSNTFKTEPLLGFQIWGA